jgi:hypothetical protein
LARFPLVKTVIKPVSITSKFESNVRLGAFEVQAYCKKDSGDTCEVLHSKLASRKWPDIDEIMSKVSSFLPKCNLFVTVYDPMNSSTALKGLKVKVYAKYSSIDRIPSASSIRPMSSITANRPASASFLARPQSSARLTTSSRAMLPKSSTTRLTQGPPRSTVYERSTDQNGSCMFEGLPIEVYEVEVVGSADYNGAVKSINLFDESQQTSSINVYVAVVGRNISTFSVKVTDAQSRTGVTRATVYLQSKTGQRLPIAEQSKGEYEIAVEYGDYWLNIEVPEFAVVRRNVSLFQPKAAIQEFISHTKKRQVQVKTFDALSGEALSSTLIELLVNQSKLSHEGLSENGAYTYELDDCGLYSVKAKRPGYVDSFKEFQVMHKEDFSVSIALVPVMSDPNLTVLVISWNTPEEGLELKVSGPRKTLSSKQTKTKNCSVFNDLFRSGIASALIKPKVFKWRRVFLTTSLPSLKERGLTASLYINSKHVITVTPAEGSGSCWDIGAVNAGSHEFIEINLLSDVVPPSCTFLLKDFAQIYKLVKNAAPHSIEEIFGFTHPEAEVKRRGKDLLIHPQIVTQLFKQSVSEQGLRHFITSVSAGEGISLATLRHRFERDVSTVQPNSISSIEEFAAELGMDLIEDAQFLYIAEEGLRAGLPDDWEVRFQDGDWVYYNFLTKSLSGRHPNIDVYRKKFKEAKGIVTPPLLELQAEEGLEEEGKEDLDASGKKHDEAPQLGATGRQASMIIESLPDSPNRGRESVELGSDSQSPRGLADSLSSGNLVEKYAEYVEDLTNDVKERVTPR